MNNNEIIITLAITVYKPQYYEIKNWLEYCELLKNDESIQLIFLIDNPNINQNILNLIEKSSTEYKIYDKNYGKFYVVKDACEKNLIKGKFLKICDPDDLLNLNNLRKFVKKISLLNYNQEYLILTGHGNIKGWYYSKWNINVSKIKTELLKSVPVNYNTILSTKALKNFPFKYKNLSKSSDSIFSITNLIDKDVIFITMEKNWFYVYNKRKGISNSTNKFNHNRKKLKKDYNKLFFDTFYYLNILLKLNEQISEIKYTNYPRKFDFYTTHNALIGSNFKLIKRILFTRKIYKIFQKIDNSEKKWNFLNLFKFYFLQIIKKRIKV